MLGHRSRGRPIIENVCNARDRRRSLDCLWRPEVKPCHHRGKCDQAAFPSRHPLFQIARNGEHQEGGLKRLGIRILTLTVLFENLHEPGSQPLLDQPLFLLSSHRHRFNSIERPVKAAENIRRFLFHQYTPLGEKHRTSASVPGLPHQNRPQCDRLTYVMVGLRPRLHPIRNTLPKQERRRSPRVLKTATTITQAQGGSDTKGGEMPLKINARLSPVARKKLKQLLRRFYHQLASKRIPDRLLAAMSSFRHRKSPDQPAPPQ
jgi:hypothetical protein